MTVRPAAPTPAPALVPSPPAVLLASAQASLMEAAERLGSIIGELTRTDTAIPGSAWTVRDAAAHLVSWAPTYAAMAGGAASPLTSLAREHIADENARLLTEVPARDPALLAELLADAVETIVAATAVPAERTVTLRGGVQGDVLGLVGVALGEFILHGYDIAGAIGAPWSIMPEDVGRVLYGYAPTLAGVVDPVATRGLTVSYDVDLGQAGRFGVSFVDGALSVTDPTADPTEASAAPADCRIEACPRAFLLVATGRLNVWTASTLGLWRGAGPKPGLARRYPGLFLTV